MRRPSSTDPRCRKVNKYRETFAQGTQVTLHAHNNNISTLFMNILNGWLELFKHEFNRIIKLKIVYKNIPAIYCLSSSPSSFTFFIYYPVNPSLHKLSSFQINKIEYIFLRKGNSECERKSWGWCVELGERTKFFRWMKWKLKIPYFLYFFGRKCEKGSNESHFETLMARKYWKVYNIFPFSFECLLWEKKKKIDEMKL